MRGGPGAAEAQAFLDREGERVPVQGFAQAHERRAELDLVQDAARLVDQDRPAVVGQVDDTVDKGQHAFEAVFGHEDREAQVAVEAHERVEDVLGGLGVELRGGFVEHQDAWSQGQGGGDGDALALAAGKGFQRAGA